MSDIRTPIGGDIWQQSRDLSSGTLANLTDITNYDVIYIIRLAFIEFCEENNNRYMSWGAAWQEFWPVYKTTREGRSLGSHA